MAQETMSFQAEVKQLLQLMIHSLYSNKEIFLRELISNASDAADKLRFEAIAKSELYENDPNLRIRVSFDKTARTITIDDNGIGMSRDEAVSHLGTIARSGTKEFFSQLSGDQQKDAALIGQFGVGFYSGFIVADKITVETRRAGLPASEGVRWVSAGEGDFSVETIERAQRGTTITLHLRADEDELLSAYRLQSIIRKYSDHVALPILMKKEEWDAEKGEMVVKDEDETVNQASALWTRPKNEVEDEQYKQFYHHLAHDEQDPLAWTHNRVEGSQSFTTLLYVPEQPPFDLMMGGREERKGLKLYIKRVFIMDAAEELLPNYMRFVRGVVDADDLPLNVSREILQQNRQLERIKGACVKRVLDLLEKISRDEPEKFATFLAGFGNTLKEGIVEDTANRERIAKLLRFASTKGEGAAKTVSFDDYIGRMAVGQDTIWYVTADSYATAAGSPQLEALKAKDIEVLLMSDRVDEWMLGYLTEYAGKRLRNVAKGEFPLDEADKAKQEAAATAAAPLLERAKALLGDRVNDVRVSARLTDSPS